jgi:HD-GYP domain-containing protein (c-di-GMP phosphodiesterase class II)
MESCDDLFLRLEQLNDIGASLSSERNIDRLLEKILVAAKQITRADGGTLYRISEDGHYLHFAIVRTDSLGIAFGGTTGEPISAQFPDLALYRDDGSPNDCMVAVHAVLHGRTVNIADAYAYAYAAAGFDFAGTCRFDARTGYRSQSFLTVPMRNHEGAVIGVLQLINAIDPVSGQVGPFDAADQRLAESLASQAAIALSHRFLIEQLETLFESFVAMINVAIDEKSPYTGGHCERVPELAMMLAEAVNATKEGAFADFELSDKDFYELKIAALLHDCGKVTTPVHVVDKATKLQTLFDRIQLLDTRFEVLKRDREIAALKAQLAARDGTGVSETDIVRQLTDEIRQLEADRDFLRRANTGSERMSDDDLARVVAIAERYRWLGPDGVEQDFLSPDELENLSIRAGTLTTAEREIINHHIVATTRMLEALPWPKHLTQVPEYAGGHHERMDGKGYPRGLKREEMSVQARMMGIADIFEALTARDRPYKPPMKLSQALQIMRGFRDSGHIDPDLYDIFEREQVYLRYARLRLRPEQIDA